MSILFQSHTRASTNQNGSKYKRGLPSDQWSDLRTFMPDDDSRDIVWKRSTDPMQIISKRREYESSLRLIFCIDTNRGDDFGPPNGASSRQQWKRQSLSLLEASAHKSRFPFSRFCGNFKMYTQSLLRTQTKDRLIIVLSSTLDIFDDTLLLLSHHNDILVVQVRHPFELHPDTSVWIQGRVFDTKKMQSYLDAQNTAKKQYKKQCKIYNISSIFVDTSQDIEAPLNHFFKYRYAKKR